FQRVQRGLGEDLGDAGEGSVFHQDDGVHVADLGALQEGGPVKAGGQPGQISGRGRVVDLVDLTTLDRGPVLFGDPGFEGQDVGGGLGRVGPAGGGQGAVYIGDIGLALRREVGLQVVVAVGQAEAA